MSQILIYSRPGKNQVNTSLEILSEKLSEIGHHTEHTHSTNWARIFLNPYHLVHLFVEQLPLTVNELFFISLAKTLGKPTILSLFNTDHKQTKPLASLVCPDALTLSQTNHFQYYRDWICTKSVLPLFPEIKNNSSSAAHGKNHLPSYLIPLEKNLEEAFQYKTDQEIYFDARSLLKENSSTNLRKQWNQYLKEKKLHPLAHLILSEEKCRELLKEENLYIVLASPRLKHTEFTAWLEKSLNRGHVIFLNEFQATGFSQAWTSGQNCQVLAAHHWPKSLNQFFASQIDLSNCRSRFKNSELTEPLVNELSRLYAKILRQNTTLISADSVKMKS
jgi:hypothetical protein